MDTLKQARQCLVTKDVTGAVRACRRSLAAQPNAVEALKLFGVAACLSGQAKDALPVLRLALSAVPNDASLNNAVSIAFRQTGAVKSAVIHARRAVNQDPGCPPYWRALAEAHVLGSNWEDARAAYRRLAHLGPLATKDHAGLGRALVALHRGQDALEHLRGVIEAGTKETQVIRDYASALDSAGLRLDAVKFLRAALRNDPDNVELATSLAESYRKGGNSQWGLRIARHGLRRSPKDPFLLNTTGLLFGSIGKPAPAVECFRTALSSRATPVVHSNAVFYSQYKDDLTSRQNFALHKRWWDLHGKKNAPRAQSWPNTPDRDRRLRIGYVSSDLRAHSCAYFLVGLFEHHDPETVEVYAYMTHHGRDAISDLIASHVAAWREVAGLSARALAQRIQEDRIDILVDLAGHTAGHSLLTFARKPAPVQVTWLGYPTTTGLPTIDWRLSDPFLTPDDTRELFSERLYRLPRASHAFSPRVNRFDLPELGPMPVDRNGFITFGSFNNLAKLSPSCLAAWAKVVEAVPGSRLRIKARTIEDPEAAQHLKNGFIAGGGDPERIDFVGGTESKRAHLERITEVDIALDSYPYGGMTTTCETLMMGVPVLTLAGERTASRYGLSVLSAVGLPELAAFDVDGLARMAATLCQDRDRLRALRAGLRERMERSSLMDHAGFARAMEAAYRDMWSQWCAPQTPIAR